MSEAADERSRPAAQRGRQLEVGETDITSSLRTPKERLWRIPEAARASFAPFIERLPALRIGENDLTRIAPGRPMAAGDVIEVRGTVRDCLGRPLRNLLIEMWGANKWGRYTHADDPAREPLDDNFLGFGRTVTDDDGRYFFRTIYPAPYLARPDIDRWRPSHLHFSLVGGSSRLVTQMYFAGDKHLAKDPCFQLLGEAQERHLITVAPSEREGVDTKATFDIVVGGRSPTMFDQS